MPSVRLMVGDCRASIRALVEAGIRVDAVCSDPPYAMDKTMQRFGKADAAPPKSGPDGSFTRVGREWIGAQWDTGDTVFDPEFWRDVYDVLLPGGYVLAFQSAESGDQMVSAMRAAGFVIHPMIVWAYAQGMPIGKGIDVGLRKAMIQAGHDPVYAGEVSANFVGIDYGTRARKAAVEPIYVAQRPFSEKNGLQNYLRWGVGVVNMGAIPTRSGNVPANLILEESPEVLAQFPEGSADRFETVEAIHYHKKADRYDRRGFGHPTIKPVGLLRRLVRSVTPYAGTVLDPFAGTGTTGEAALAEGFNVILMEREEPYADMIRSRLEGSICYEY